MPLPAMRTPEELSDSSSFEGEAGVDGVVDVDAVAVAFVDFFLGEKWTDVDVVAATCAHVTIIVTNGLRSRSIGSGRHTTF